MAVVTPSFWPSAQTIAPSLLTSSWLGMAAFKSGSWNRHGFADVVMVGVWNI